MKKSEFDALIAQARRGREEALHKPTLGKRFEVPRVGKAPVRVILHAPQTPPARPMPVLFNLHGGCWIGGDATLMESFCALIAEKTPAVVVNVDYTKLDEQTFPYPQEELCDAVTYFTENAANRSIDAGKAVVCGHSAGAHICAGAALFMQEKLRAQILVYPVTDFAAEMDADDDGLIPHLRAFVDGMDLKTPLISPLYAPDALLRTLGKTAIVLCGKDRLRGQGAAYAKRLSALGVDTEIFDYPEAMHGFLEVNRPDYPSGDERRTPQQDAMARDCEEKIIAFLRSL